MNSFATVAKVVTVTTPRPPVTEKSPEEILAMSVYAQTGVIYADAVKVFQKCKKQSADLLVSRSTYDYLEADKIYCAHKISLGNATSKIATDKSQEALRVFIECTETKNNFRSNKDGVIYKTEKRIEDATKAFEESRAALTIASANFNRAANETYRLWKLRTA